MTENPEGNNNKQWTEEERLALAAKLDSELDEFMNSLESRRYTEGWPEDRWQEEMDKHPFFMKKAPQPGDEVHPMFEGLQKLKYDPEENTMEELALNYKEDGNFYMKHKKFRMAVYSYTEGIKTKCENPEVLAVLYNNRGAANFFLQNYRSALSDSQHTLTLKPDYAKARWRAARCAFQIEKFDVCHQLCNDILQRDPNSVDAKELLEKNRKKKLTVERNKRKEAADAKKRMTLFNQLCDALKKRNVKFGDLKSTSEPITAEILRPHLLPLEDFPVHIDGEGGLVWPAVTLYPEFMISDFHQQLSENVIMKEFLISIFEKPLACDHSNSYRPDNVNVYYKNHRNHDKVHKVDLSKTIGETIQEDGFFVFGGSLEFFIVPAGSKAEETFLNI